ncbi:type IV pilus assembly protein PilY1 [Duganella sp. 1411]|jgi:type IV pilus assembly protein PilY1|uniref:pilus assembly protein n=1 Tax=Duganella sp. 1411 TaxID=2806572 RepID=UPI001AE5F00A|nr:PilC/PilY family type IV pilus protein [Duganella sp. 1411]MBP1205278.1 type IV pilus assembly protein PilY1 [Duganella sp. 1411]
MQIKHLLIPAAMIIAAAAQAAPPSLDIASEPLTAACRAANPRTVAAEFEGASLLHPAPPPASASAGDLFQASTNPTDWSGHFSRYTLLPGAAGLPSTPTAAWDAGVRLTGDATNAPSPAPAARKIFTAIVQPDGTLDMIPFEWNALSAEQRLQLDQAPSSTIPDALGEQRLAFLRGDRTQEGKLFRARGGVLGDSIHSTPVYVEPSVARPGVIYIGANDGMLHAFNAADGAELFAYVPNALFSSLNRLADPDYSHRAYVDGPASAGEAMISGAGKTVLISGMGGGAQGVFALDVTDPTRFSDGGGVLWEFTDRDDAMMGNVTTRPQIAKLRTRTAAGVPVYRHFAVVASGLNNYAADGHASPTGKGALFLLAVDKPRDAPWQLNVNYYRLITPIADATLANALNAPVLVTDRAGALRYGYAGDLQGNLWRFDFTGGAPWVGAVGPGAGGAPLFVARDVDGKRQPIAQQPLLAYADGGGYLVLFGTGKLIEKADRTSASFAPQSYYAIRDSLHTPADIVTSRNQLTQRILGGDAGMPAFSIGGANMAYDSMGWYVDLLQAATTGERSIDSGVLAGGEVFFNTLLPGADTCDKARKRTYALNVLTGLAERDSVVTRLPVPASIEQAIIGRISDGYRATPSLLPVTATRTPRDPTGRARLYRELAVADLTPQGMVAAGHVQVQLRAGRLSWREVGNWRELHGAAK